MRKIHTNRTISDMYYDIHSDGYIYMIEDDGSSYLRSLNFLEDCKKVNFRRGMGLNSRASYLDRNDHVFAAMHDILERFR